MFEVFFDIYYLFEMIITLKAFFFYWHGVFRSITWLLAGDRVSGGRRDTICFVPQYFVIKNNAVAKM